MNKFGVCRCDLNSHDPRITELVRFDDYHAAQQYYMECIAQECQHSFLLPDDLWLVIIDDECNCVIQFERFDLICKTRQIDLPTLNT